jgi:hypothetical protein
MEADLVATKSSGKKGGLWGRVRGITVAVAAVRCAVPNIGLYLFRNLALEHRRGSEMREYRVGGRSARFIPSQVTTVAMFDRHNYFHFSPAFLLTSQREKVCRTVVDGEPRCCQGIWIRARDCAKSRQRGPASSANKGRPPICCTLVNITAVTYNQYIWLTFCLPVILNICLTALQKPRS